MSMINFIVRPYKKGEEDFIAEAHERVYLEEYNWGPEFGNYAKQIAYDFAAAPKNPREDMWVAEVNNNLAGCIMLNETKDPKTAQLRLFLVEKEYRKNKVGSALTKIFMDKVRECGYEKIILWTANILTIARKHYGKMGFRYVEGISNNSWSLSGQKIIEEKWEMKL
ncbi:MAG: GNAT family N-acetyltransferase [Spirochaetales bacterium]|nr:GNAT family N-acetyltransferase [Spirochaetales bacterium]